MKVTLLLSFVLMAALFLLIWAAVALVQSKKLFTTAPKDIQAAALEHGERFPGARILGWLLLVILAAAFLARLSTAAGTGYSGAMASGSFSDGS